MGEFARHKAVFLALLETNADGRAAELSRLCAGDGSLRAGVEALLLAHARRDTPLDRAAVVTPGASRGFGGTGPDARYPAEAEEDDPLGVGESFGRYEIVGRLGAGAMGIVYEARHAGTDRLVALKVIRPERASPGARRRFEAEGRALARLRHPAIAQLYEAGVERLGDRRVPYIAMELVRGRPITEAVTGLTLEQRFELFAAVCGAVHHAHLSGVVHRDLKPANVLVEGDPSERGIRGADAEGSGASARSPKVLDFGVAKLTEGEGDAHATADGQIVGTPAYMSPEQLAADVTRVDHRSDVYALGVLLYELLAGRRPLEPEGATLFAAVRSLEGRIPARLGAVNRALRGDPEAIVHKALERDPARRYQSAGELAEDVRRLLQRRPVQARRPTRTYITARFVRRNPWPVGLGLTAAAALALGTAGTLVQARQAVVARARAEARLGETRSLAHAIIFDLHDLVARLPGSTEARLALVSTAERFYGPLAADPDADGRFRLEIAEMYLRLGGIRGYTPRPSLGDSEAAIRYYSAALSILEPLRLEQPQSAPVALALSQALLRKAHIVAGPAEVEAARRAAALLQPFELSPAIAAQLVECRYRIGLALWRRWGVPPAESVDGLPDLRAAAALGEKACTLWPDHRDVVFARVEAEFWLGYVLLEMEHMAAREPLERALAHCDALFRAHAGDAAIRQRLGSVHDAMARWHARWGERGEAIAAAERAAASASDLVDADPEDYLAARSQFVWHAHAGEMYELLADRSGDAQDVRSALHHYGEYQRLLREHVARGWLSPEESRYPEEAAQAIARCQGRLASLGPDAP